MDFSSHFGLRHKIIHKVAPHAPMADVYYGPDGRSPNDMRFSKL